MPIPILLSDVERQAWDPDVDVYFQPNALTDTQFCAEWVERMLKPMVEDEDYYVLL